LIATIRTYHSYNPFNCDCVIAMRLIGIYQDIG
jgi:hypothetical protein